MKLIYTRKISYKILEVGQEIAARSGLHVIPASAVGFTIVNTVKGEGPLVATLALTIGATYTALERTDDVLGVQRELHDDGMGLVGYVATHDVITHEPLPVRNTTGLYLEQ